MEELIRRTVGPQITLEVVTAGGLWPTLIDPSQLENALLNLCINARDAMPEGGRITIETANKWLDERAAKERDLPPGQYLSLCVTDTGTGMTPDVIARAFDPFFTTKPIGQGTGLGLSMVYGFVRQSGGQVRIYSEVGQRHHDVPLSAAPLRRSSRDRRRGARPQRPRARADRQDGAGRRRRADASACWSPKCWKNSATSRSRPRTAPPACRVLQSDSADRSADHRRRPARRHERPPARRRRAHHAAGPEGAVHHRLCRERRRRQRPARAGHAGADQAVRDGDAGRAASSR